MIEELKLLSIGGRFHSQIRYQAIYDSEWACYYFLDCCFVHEKCEIQVYRASDVISWNAQRIAKAKAVNLVENGPVIAKQTSVLDAHQVLDKMSESNADAELIVLGEIGDQLVVESELEAPPSGFVERLADAKNLEEGEPRETIPTTRALKFELTEQASLLSGVVNAVCFDPGGNILSQRDHSMCLSDKNSESPGVEDNKLVDEVFPEFSESYVSAGPDTRKSCAQHAPQLVVERNLNEKFEILRFSMVVDFLAKGSMFSSFPNGA